jgi:Prokaryotic N-terminal methylation motif
MPRRRGATLVEVLVAIFIMGIGMIALLTLFPLGAIRMAQAIQDNTCANAVVNANATATIWDIRNDVFVNTPPALNTTGAGFAPTINVFTDKIPTQNRPLPADPNGPSYPVWVDPVGMQYSGSNWLAQISYKGYIARVPVSFMYNATGTLNPTAVSKWFWLLDDFIFENNEAVGGGTPFNFSPLAAAPVIRRDVRYSWAYLMQRPRSSDPSIATCSVAIYKNRPLTGLTTLSESAFGATFDVTTNTISVDWSKSPRPNVNIGDWILDATYVPGPTYGTCHGYFYRVVGITQVGANKVDNYEVQQKIRGFPTSNASAPLSGTIITLEGVVDVYERGLDRKFN